MVSALAAVVTVHGSVERTFTYAIAQRGAIHADMHAFAAFVSRVYADPRGWSLGGRVAFRQVQTGADFTVWLASADEMASFGGGCSRQWDCRASFSGERFDDEAGPAADEDGRHPLEQRESSVDALQLQVNGS